jgi:DNA-binding NtrC family response regulator
VRDDTARILVVDDEPAVVDFLTRTLRHAARRVKACYDANSALEYARKEKPDLLVADYGLPGMDGVSLSRTLKEADPELEVILITGDHPDWDSDFLPSNWDWVAKPFQGPRLRWVAEHALERHRLRRENRWLSNELTWDPPFAFAGARSPSIQLAIHEAKSFVKGDDSLLWISGENGVGKRSLARWIHEFSPVSTRPLLMLSAQEAKAERLQQWNEGTLIVTGAEALSHAFGAALLRRLEESAIGKSRTDWKVILLSESQPHFQNTAIHAQDGLRHLMQVNHIHLPPLRQRVEDLFPLISHCLREWASAKSLSVPKMELTALRLLETHPWAENARELNQVLQEALATSQNQVTAESLKAVLRRYSTAFLELNTNQPHKLEDVERQVLSRTLKAHGGDKASTAKELGISVRTLYRKLRQFQSLSSGSGTDLGGIKVEGESGAISG